MGSLAAVGIHNNLAARQARVAVGSANYKFAGGVNQVAHLGGKQALHATRQQLFNARNQVALNVGRDAVLHGLFVGKIVVLGRNNYRVNGLRNIAVAVANRYLTLGVGPQVLHHLALLADGGQFAKQQVAEFQGKRHVGIGFVGGVAKHNALVASALLFFRRAVYTLVDVGRLLVNRAEYPAGSRFKHVLRFRVANAANYVARNFTGIDVGAGLNFSGKHHLTGGYQGFAGHLRIGVKC